VPLYEGKPYPAWRRVIDAKPATGLHRIDLDPHLLKIAASTRTDDGGPIRLELLGKGRALSLRIPGTPEVLGYLMPVAGPDDDERSS
jgi:hypothetical protein